MSPKTQKTSPKTHDMGDASRWTAEQKMGVVVHKNPGVGRFGFQQAVWVSAKI